MPAKDKGASCIPVCGSYQYDSISPEGEQQKQIDGNKHPTPRPFLSLELSDLGKCLSYLLRPLGLSESCDRLFEAINDLLTDQDFKQRYSVMFAAPAEFTKFYFCSMLMITVPQKCNRTVCSASENLEKALQFNEEGQVCLFQIALALNALTMLALFALYFVELWREHVAIEFLEVNPKRPSDLASVQSALYGHLSKRNQDKVFRADGSYKALSICCYWFYLANVVVSAIGVNHYVLGESLWSSPTLSSFLALAYLMKGRLEFAFTIAHQPKEVIYSAYIKEKVMFNDVDPDHNVELVGQDTGEGIAGIAMVGNLSRVVTSVSTK